MKKIFLYILLFFSGIALGVLLFSGNGSFRTSSPINKQPENNYLAVEKPVDEQKRAFVQSAIPMLGKEVIVNGTIQEGYKNQENELVLYDGIKELLEELKAKGHKLAVATNAYRGSTIESLTHLGIHDYFDALACYDDVPQGKPHPDMLYKILDELEHSKEKSLFIGDGPRDEMASKRAEIPYVMVDWGFTEHVDAVRSVNDLKRILLGN
jgi:HAD superfamily hydrolase (TIGR01509 family)